VKLAGVLNSRQTFAPTQSELPRTELPLRNSLLFNTGQPIALTRMVVIEIISYYMVHANPKEGIAKGRNRPLRIPQSPTRYETQPSVTKTNDIRQVKRIEGGALRGVFPRINRNQVESGIRPVNITETP
jgi:hypothetical protein